MASKALTISFKEMKKLNVNALRSMERELVDEVEYLEEEWMDERGTAGPQIWDEWKHAELQLNRCRYLLGELK